MQLKSFTFTQLIHFYSNSTKFVMSPTLLLGERYQHVGKHSPVHLINLEHNEADERESNLRAYSLIIVFKTLFRLFIRFSV